MPNVARVATAGAGGFSLNGPASIPPAPAATQENTGIVPPWLGNEPVLPIEPPQPSRHQQRTQLEAVTELHNSIRDALDALRWASAENTAISLGIQPDLRQMFRTLRDEIQPAVIDARDNLQTDMGIR